MFSFEGMIKGRQVKNLSFLLSQFTRRRPSRQIRACTKICLLGPTKGAPLHEQKELRSSGKHRRCEFANGACERTANAKTLREDRTAFLHRAVPFSLQCTFRMIKCKERD